MMGKYSRIPVVPFILLLLAVCLSVSWTQSSSIDLDEMYAYPLGVSVYVGSFSPVVAVGTDFGYSFSVNDISAAVSYPLPLRPVFQPYLQLGLMTYTSSEGEDGTQAEQFNHRQAYLSGGLGYLSKMSKQLEVGILAGAGLSQSYFDDLGGAAETVGQTNIIADLAGRLGLNVSYNLHLGLEPRVRYTKTLGLLDRFDGLTFGIGFTGQYRLGEDPDSPKAELKSIRFLDGAVSDIFAALQSYYVGNTIGSVAFKNDDKYPLENVDVSFFQAGYMDGPTPLETFDRIDPGEERQVDLYAAFNNRVFETEGITPLTGEIIVQYTSRSRTNAQRYSVTYDMYDKEALSWDDTRKAAAFVTPADSALRNFSSYVRQVSRERVVPGFSGEMQTAMQAYYGLKELGLIYQLDPTSPFTVAQEDSGVIDAVSIPRNTLKRLTGDCDDLSVLYSSLLEAAGVETAFVTVPGHIYVAFNTKVPAREYQLIHPAQNMTINIANQLWVPVEITMVGTDDFLSAWRTGVQEFDSYKEFPEKRELINVREAQQTYRPVGLQETDLGLQYGDAQLVARNFSRDITRLIDDIIASYTRVAEQSNNKAAYNRLGIISARFNNYTVAEKAFNTALSLDRNYLSARINLANVFFQRNEFQNALRVLHAVEKEYITSDRADSRSNHIVLLNISRCYYSLENFDMAEQYLARLQDLNPELAAEFSYLGTQDGARASRGGSAFTTIFVEED
jgi:predicted negative regulator of RcsB-dependent stress response